jgi:hypothetical protein
MMLGMSLATFTLVHVVISLIGIASGLAVLFGWIAGKRLETWTTVFLITTILTSVTGYGFPVEHLLPSHIVGVISLVVLAVALLTRRSFGVARGWRKTFVISSVVALYLNVFVLVVQSFQKVPFLRALAPTQNEPPFAVAQVAVLLAFIALGTLAVKRSRNLAVQPA